MLEKFMESTASKDKSLKLLYGLIRKLGPVRINTLSEITGYKHATCTRLLDELVQEGLIYDSGIGESSGGRKPLMYVIKPDAFYVIGAEISSFSAAVLLLDLNLEIIGSRKLTLDPARTGKYLLDFIAQSVDELVDEHQIPKNKLLGIGVGFSGVDEKDQDMPAHSPIAATGWRNGEATEYLQQTTNVLVLLDDAANLAALAAYRQNYWKQADSLVYVSNDKGIRCGIVFQGKLIRGKAEMADAFGHMIVDLHGRRCACGAYGCLETYSSFPAIRSEVVRQLKRGRSSCLLEFVEDAEQIRLPHILAALKAEDALCLEVMKDAAYYFGIGLSNLIFLLRPDIVVCGSTLMPSSFFYEKAAEAAQNRLKQYSNSQVRIVSSMECLHLVGQGAGCMVLDHYAGEQ
jgi:predicted NBD/HSP70 family sugar kinase